ncbi:molybdopterin-dependent oxidoreductase [Phenylobacterium aquaticum]|uniref:molybdopterin-dependent oxidoreductase n=1 Tax=Phenylobacterium aquaticum TaxID=1763816 RepID=UPI0026E981BE|nr:molybdopterin-dependent oxidoreductase [Phenylobacterium aquaticum]
MTPDRRGWLKGLAASGAGLWLAACDKLNESAGVQKGLASAQGLTLRAQRLFQSRKALAQEFTPADIARDFRANGSISPGDPAYRQLLTTGFKAYRLVIDGLVDHPLTLSLADLRAQPSRTQITRHDCVEGWSSIGQWKGARLGPLLDRAGLKREARYLVFHCFDSLEETLDGSGQYYESIDLIDGYHPQTILAYEMNGQVLPVAHGAPLRLRVERHLGYKHAKYISRIEAVADFAHLGQGKGGYWEDRGYEWYGGI